MLRIEGYVNRGDGEPKRVNRHFNDAEQFVNWLEKAIGPTLGDYRVEMGFMLIDSIDTNIGRK